MLIILIIIIIVIKNKSLTSLFTTRYSSLILTMVKHEILKSVQTETIKLVNQVGQLIVKDG